MKRERLGKPNRGARTNSVLEALGRIISSKTGKKGMLAAETLVFAAGCTFGYREATPQPKSTPTNEGLGGTPTLIFPTEIPTSTQVPTATPELIRAVTGVEVTNMSDIGLGEEEIEAANQKVEAFRSAIMDGEVALPEGIAGVSIKDFYRVELKESRGDFSYTVFDVLFGKEDGGNVLAQYFEFTTSKGESVYFPIIDLSLPSEIAAAATSFGILNPELVNRIWVTPAVSPEGRLIDPYGKELDAGVIQVLLAEDGRMGLNPKEPILISPTVIFSNEALIITSPEVNLGALPTEVPREASVKALTVLPELSREINSSEGEWVNSPEEIIVGNQSYDVYRVVDADGEKLLAGRVGRSLEEMIADPYMQLAEARMNIDTKWVWEYIKQEPMSWKNLLEYAALDCLPMPFGQVLPALTDIAHRMFNLGFGGPPGYKIPPEVVDINGERIPNTDSCWVLGLRIAKGKFAVYKDKAGNDVIIPVLRIR